MQECKLGNEQGVNDINIASRKQKGVNEKSTGTNVEASQVQGSETFVTAIDTTDTTAVVKEVLQGRGNRVMRKVSVQALNNKSTDLKLCLSQQANAFGFLPITNIQRLRRGHSLRPNKVLTYHEFDPIKVYSEVKRTGSYNFMFINFINKQKFSFHPKSTLNCLNSYVRVIGIISYPILSNLASLWTFHMNKK